MHLLRAALTLCSVLLLNAGTLSTQWVQSNGFSEGMVFSLAVDGVRIFAGSINGIFVSTDNGMSWTAANNGLAVTSVTCLLVSPPIGGEGTSSVSAGTSGGVFISTDAGEHWTAINAGLTTTYVNSLAVGPLTGTPGRMNLFAGTAGGGVFRSTNNGADWKSTGLSTTQVLALAASDTNLLAGGFIGVYRSADDGANWTHVDGGLGRTPVNELAINRLTAGSAGSSVFAGSAGGGVFLSTNNGVRWRAVNEGLNETSISALAVRSTDDGSFLFAGTFDGTIWRRPLSDMITSVHPYSGDVPTSNSLSQDYPNPFNPTSEIRYEISEIRHVRLVVYDLLGREVAILVDEVKQSGAHTVQFDGRNLASGMYVCRLQVGDPSTGLSRELSNGSGQVFVARMKLLLLR